VSISARHELELPDGQRVLLLDDRGWGSSARWTDTTAEDVRTTTGVVVGPDEPSGDRTPVDMAAAHWATLADTVHRQGVAVDAGELARLPHDVVLDPAVLARLAGRDAQEPDWRQSTRLTRWTTT
jgi:hypothetical protein